MTNSTITIRRAAHEDAAALSRLAVIDSASPPTGDALVAEVGDELWAALEINSGNAIADPFRHSGEVVDLLRFSAARMRMDSSERRSLRRLRPRAA
ncbi:MAG TPA: hypothetical protein VEQ61_09600 [Thermoleophilaceae bacterium]|nr:hypothetical protein [Thermoleophilaceae bacterium]